MEVAFDALGRILVIDQLFPKRLGQDVFGQIVAGGAKPSGGDDDVRPRLGQGDSLLGPLGVVPHDSVPVDVQAQCAQALGENLRVQICDIAQ